MADSSGVSAELADGVAEADIDRRASGLKIIGPRATIGGVPE
jgi:hypothetical protein